MAKKKSLYKVIENALNRGRDVEIFVAFQSYYGETIRTRLISGNVCRYTDDVDPTSHRYDGLYTSCFYDDGMTVSKLVRDMRRYDRQSLKGKIVHVNVL
jgi:hypothetical protein